MTQATSWMKREPVIGLDIRYIHIKRDISKKRLKGSCDIKYGTFAYNVFKTGSWEELRNFRFPKFLPRI